MGFSARPLDPTHQDDLAQAPPRTGQHVASHLRTDSLILVNVGDAGSKRRTLPEANPASVAPFVVRGNLARENHVANDLLGRAAVAEQSDGSNGHLLID